MVTIVVMGIWLSDMGQIVRYICSRLSSAAGTDCFSEFVKE